MVSKETFNFVVRVIFNLVVRLIGLTFLYQGLAAVPVAIANFCPVFPHFNFRTLLPSLILVGWPLVMAYWMVRGAPWLMRLAFGAEDARAARQEATNTTSTLL